MFNKIQKQNIDTDSEVHSFLSQTTVVKYYNMYWIVWKNKSLMLP